MIADSSKVNNEHTVLQDSPEEAIQVNMSSIASKPIETIHAVENGKRPAGSVMGQHTDIGVGKLIRKPIVLSNFTWSTTNVAMTVLDQVNIPSEIQTKNTLLAIPFRNSAYYHLEGKIIVHLTGTPMHAGILIVAVMPPCDSGFVTVQDMLCAPHAFIYANQASAVEIDLPWYHGTYYKRTGATSVVDYSSAGAAYERRDVASIYVKVVSPLQTGGTATTTLNGHVDVMLSKADFHVPTNLDATFQPSPTALMGGMQPLIARRRGSGLLPVKGVKESALIDGAFGYAKNITADALDRVRSTVRRYTGLHNKNQPVMDHMMYSMRRNNINYVDSFVRYEKLDGFADYNRHYDKDYFGTAPIDEMSVPYLMSKIQHVTTFTMTTANVRGDVLFARPIVPTMSSESDGGFRSIHRKIASLAVAWSGDMELVIQSSMTNFQHCKLMVALYYNKTTNINTSFPTLDSVLGCPNSVLEFGGGGSVQCVDLPFATEFPHIPVTLDASTAWASHGVAYIYVLEPLVVGDQQPTSAFFNVYLKCKPSGPRPFSLYGLSNRQYQIRPTYINPEAAAAVVGEKESGGECKPKSDLSEVKNVTSQQCVNTSCFDPHTDTTFTSGMMRPFLHLRDAMRRLYPTQRWLFASTASTVLDIDLSTLVFEPQETVTPFQLITTMFRGYRGGLRVKLEVSGATSAKLWYAPPAFAYNPATVPSNTLVQTVFSHNAVSAEYINDATAYLGARPGTGMYQIDNANYYVSSAGTATPNTGVGAANAYGSSTVVIEGEIPYNSALDFLGGMTAIATTEPANSYSYSFGALRLTWVPQSTTNRVAVTLYLGADDSARVGMQVLTAVVRETVASDGTFATVYDMPGAVNSSGNGCDAVLPVGTIIV